MAGLQGQLDPEIEEWTDIGAALGSCKSPVSFKIQIS